jgi:hypothetical protein
MNLTEQRTAIQTAIKLVYTNPVHLYPNEGKVAPPCVCIGKPAIVFPQNSSMALATWPIVLYETRTDPDAAMLRLETKLTDIMLELRKGAGIGLVLQTVEGTDVEIAGTELPAYQIIATSPLQNC